VAMYWLTLGVLPVMIVDSYKQFATCSMQHLYYKYITQLLTQQRQ